MFLTSHLHYIRHSFRYLELNFQRIIVNTHTAWSLEQFGPDISDKEADAALAALRQYFLQSGVSPPNAFRNQTSVLSVEENRTQKRSVVIGPQGGRPIT